MAVRPNEDGAAQDRDAFPMPVVTSVRPERGAGGVGTHLISAALAACRDALCCLGRIRSGKPCRTPSNGGRARTFRYDGDTIAPSDSSVVTIQLCDPAVLAAGIQPPPARARQRRCVRCGSHPRSCCPGRAKCPSGLAPSGVGVYRNRVHPPAWQSGQGECCRYSQGTGAHSRPAAERVECCLPARPLAHPGRGTVSSGPAASTKKKSEPSGAVRRDDMICISVRSRRA
jgi:hypothetical protein